MKRFALRNVASIIKIDNIVIHRFSATIWMIPASFEHKMADHLCNAVRWGEILPFLLFSFNTHTNCGQTKTSFVTLDIVLFCV